MRGDYWQVCDGHGNQRQSDPVNESTLSTFSLGKKACVICFSLVMAVVCKDMQVCIFCLHIHIHGAYWVCCGCGQPGQRLWRVGWSHLRGGRLEVKGGS